MIAPRTLIAWVVVLSFVPVPATRADVTLPADFDEEIRVSGLDKPTAFAWSLDGRIFVSEKDGRVRVVSAAGQLLPTPFVTVPVNTDTDRGIIGLALHPEFPRTPYVYLAYTTDLVPDEPKNALSRIHRITRFTANGDVALPGSEVVLVDDIPSDTDSHAGGSIRFGPDGKLYVTTGDGSPYDSANALAMRALDLDQLTGKVLRVEPDGSAPADNPFYTTPDAVRSKVWQYGLRNPFKATFRPGTGTLYVNDVGWTAYDEVNVGVAGASFGWPCFEGSARHPLYEVAFPETCGVATQTAPLHVYPHTTAGGAITGGVFFQGENYPAQYLDKYFFADYTQQFIQYLEVTPADTLVSVNPFATGDDAFRPVDLALAPDGDLHYLNIASDFTVPSGSIHRIAYVGRGNHAPRPRAEAQPTSGYAPLSVTFSAEASTDPDGDALTYHWSFGDGAQADGPRVAHTYTADGAYVAVVQVDDGHVVREAKATVTVGSLPPRVTITEPSPDHAYQPGEVIRYSGSATDPDEGPLPPAALRFTVIQHHDAHQHPYQDSVGTTGSFLAVDHGVADDAIVYELVLTATDASGLSATRRLFLYADVPPSADAGGDVSVACALPGSTVVLDGSGSRDPSNRQLAYSWTQLSGPAVVLEDDATPTPSFTPPALAGGSILTFQLTVTRGELPRKEERRSALASDRPRRPGRFPSSRGGEGASAQDLVNVSVPDLTDADGDLSPQCSDCAPLDPANPVPVEATGLMFESDKSTLTWSAVAGALEYDLVRGPFAGSFAYRHACYTPGHPTPTASDLSEPGVGAGLYYLVRAVNACGEGSLGVASDGVERPAAPCP